MERQLHERQGLARVADRSERLLDGLDMPSRHDRVAAGERRDVVAAPVELRHKPMHDPLGAAVRAGRDALEGRCDLGDPQSVWQRGSPRDASGPRTSSRSAVLVSHPGAARGLLDLVVRVEIRSATLLQILLGLVADAGTAGGAHGTTDHRTRRPGDSATDRPRPRHRHRAPRCRTRPRHHPRPPHRRSRRRPRRSRHRRQRPEGHRPQHRQPPRRERRRLLRAPRHRARWCPRSGHRPPHAGPSVDPSRGPSGSGRGSDRAGRRRRRCACCRCHPCGGLLRWDRLGGRTDRTGRSERADVNSTSTGVSGECQRSVRPHGRCHQSPRARREPIGTGVRARGVSGVVHTSGPHRIRSEDERS